MSRVLAVLGLLLALCGAGVRPAEAYPAQRAAAAGASLCASRAAAFAIAASGVVPTCQPGFVQSYVPSFTGTALLSSVSGLSASGGGIVATSAGVTGTGSFRLPSAIDPTKPFMVTMLVKVGSDTSNVLTLKLGSDANPWWSGVVITVQPSAITAGAGNTTLFNQIGGAGTAPAGTQFWVSVVGDGQRVTLSLIPNIALGSFAAQGIQQNPAFQAAYNQINFKSDPITNVTGGAGDYTWGSNNGDDVTTLYVSDASTSNGLLGVWASVGAIVGPPDTAMGAPAIFELNNAQDNVGVATQTPVVLLPVNHGQGFKFIFEAHPNANPGTLGGSNSKSTVLQLWSAGYGLGDMTGAQSSGDYAGPTSSHWGAEPGLAYRRNYLATLRLAVPRVGALYVLGLSMGAQTGLALIRGGWPIKAMAVVSGAYDLADSFTNRGFSSVINSAYGDFYVCIQANTGNDPSSSPAYWTKIAGRTYGPGLALLNSPYTWKSGSAWAVGTAYVLNDVVFEAYAGGVAGLAAWDPQLNPAQFKAVPMAAWHGDADTTIPIAQMTAFATAVNGAGGSVTTHTVASGTHLGTTVYDPTAVQAFFDAN